MSSQGGRGERGSLSSAALCVVCGETVETRQAGNYRRIEGWEQTRRGGGANRIARRIDHPEWVHRFCFETDRLVGQGMLL